MKIGILEAGLLREEMASRFAPYPRMFTDFLALATADFDYRTISVVRGEMPAGVHDCDGWLITGSRHGVYDRLDWMPPLEDFVRQLASARVPLIGVCFGHQIIASALGGEVVKSERGWGVGLHRYQVDRRHAWMYGDEKWTSLYAFHQDQVITSPAEAEVFLSSEFCPCAGLSYGDSIISVQAHPEFGAEYETALLEAYGGSVVPAAVAAAGLDSMGDGARADTALLANWFANFFLSRWRQQAAGNG
jgi:GMP synthase-like glutamine amidotransferase